jgi:hypothetical protein
MTRLLLLLGFVFLQVSPEAHVPIERPRRPSETAEDSLPPPTGARVPVLVEGLEGLPAAPRDREAFLRGFRGAFQESELPTERVARKSGAVRADAPVRNRLRPAEGVGEKGAWRVRVRLSWFAPPDSAADSLLRSWPGRDARVLVTVAWPEEERSAPPEQARNEWLRFPPGRPLDAVWYQHAGWQIGLLALEAVQRAAGDLDDDQRLRLDDARRVVPAPAR